MWFLPVVRDIVDISAGTNLKASHCTLTLEGGRKYLCGNLWRQEIETPCCEHLGKKKEIKQIE